MTRFNATTIVSEALEEHGYKLSKDWVNSTCGPGEYVVNHRATGNFFRVRMKSSESPRYCLIKIDKQRLHFHGSQVDCRFINLADPGSLTDLHSAISCIETPNGHPGKS